MFHDDVGDVDDSSLDEDDRESRAVLNVDNEQVGTIDDSSSDDDDRKLSALASPDIKGAKQADIKPTPKRRRDLRRAPDHANWLDELLALGHCDRHPRYIADLDGRDD